MTDDAIYRLHAIEKLYANIKKDWRCWVWQGETRGSVGYGVLVHKGEEIEAHRLSYILHKGEIPEGMHVYQICHNSRCVKPDHLRVDKPKRNQHMIKHPSLSAYARGCRCDECSAIKSKYYRERAKRMQQ